MFLLIHVLINNYKYIYIIYIIGLKKKIIYSKCTASDEAIN